MDINRDLSDPRHDMIKLKGGKYIYVDPISSKFYIDRFSRYFQQYRDKRRIEMRRGMEEKLDSLLFPEPEIPIYQEPIQTIAIAAKDSIFETLDDILQNKLSIETFTKDNRLFFIGLTLILIAIFVYIYSILLESDN